MWKRIVEQEILLKKEQIFFPGQGHPHHAHTIIDMAGL
jgi:hypothetical protein